MAVARKGGFDFVSLLRLRNATLRNWSYIACDSRILKTSSISLKFLNCEFSEREDAAVRDNLQFLAA